MNRQPIARIKTEKKTQAQIDAEAQAEAIAKAEVPDASRAEAIARGWRVRDDALWNPFEVLAFFGCIVFGFGFLLGQSHYGFVLELFSPVIVIALVVLVFQWVLRRKAGQSGALGMMRDRIR